MERGDMIADTTIYGSGNVIHESGMGCVYTVTGKYGQIVEIIHRRPSLYVSPLKGIAKEHLIGADYMGHQINEDDGSLAVWYWKGIDDGGDERE